MGGEWELSFAIFFIALGKAVISVFLVPPLLVDKSDPRYDSGGARPLQQQPNLSCTTSCYPTVQ